MVPFERAFSFLVVGSSFVTCVAVIAEHSFLCSVHVVLLHLFCSITSASERNNKLIKIIIASIDIHGIIPTDVSVLISESFVEF